jgi:hypothetical protein
MIRRHDKIRHVLGSKSTPPPFLFLISSPALQKHCQLSNQPIPPQSNISHHIHQYIKASNQSYVCVCVCLTFPHIPPALYESTSHILGATVQMKKKGKQPKKTAILKAQGKRKQRKNNNGWFYLNVCPRAPPHKVTRLFPSISVRFVISVHYTHRLTLWRCLFRPPHPTSLGMSGKPSPPIHIITS